MAAMDDMDLLREYAARGSEQAFAALVTRHVDMVYSVAMRRTGNHHHAQEVTQAVFIILAKKARALPAGTVLSGWLFHTARLTASNFVRAEIRRSRREQEAYMQSTVNENGADDWQRIAPLVDDAIADLGEKDRDAIVMRFVKGQDNKAVATALGTSEEAAQVRVSRAVEKLRKAFTKRGVVLTGAGITGAIAANSVQSAPAGLAALVSASVAQGAAAGTTLALVKGTMKLMSWTRLQMAVLAAAAAVIGGQTYENVKQARQVTTLEQQLQQQSQAQQDQAEAQNAAIEKLRQENDEMAAGRRAADATAARLLAERKEAEAATTTATAPAAPASSIPSQSGLAQLLSDPVSSRYLRDAELGKMRRRYGPLIHALNLTSDQTDEFVELTGDNRMTNIVVGVAFGQGTLSRDAAHQAVDSATADLATQLQALLGNAGYAQYQQYNEQYPAQTAVNLLNDQLGDSPLTSDQSARLAQTILSEPPGLTRGLSGDADAAQFGSPETVEAYFQQVSASQQRLLQEAAGFLTPEQLAAYGNVLSNNLAEQRAKSAALIQSH
jgi:RNA polymerase sigma factor (sigma-70 family)